MNGSKTCLTLPTAAKLACIHLDKVPGYFTVIG